MRMLLKCIVLLIKIIEYLRLDHSFQTKNISFALPSYHLFLGLKLVMPFPIGYFFYKIKGIPISFKYFDTPISATFNFCSLPSSIRIFPFLDDYFFFRSVCSGRKQRVAAISELSSRPSQRSERRTDVLCIRLFCVTLGPLLFSFVQKLLGLYLDNEHFSFFFSVCK